MTAGSDSQERIEGLRAEYGTSTVNIRDLEFGPDPAAQDDSASAVSGGYLKDYDLSWLATISSVTAPQGWFLYRLARLLRPGVIVELGTCVGFSAAYLAAALKDGGIVGHVHTVEGGAERVQWAVRTLRRLGLDDVVTVNHLRHEVAVVDLVPRIGPVDLAFVDSDHLRKRTLAYSRALRSCAGPSGVIVFDDIDWSAGMKRAWAEIRELADPGNGVYEWHSFGVWARSATSWEEAGCESLLSLPR